MGTLTGTSVARWESDDHVHSRQDYVDAIRHGAFAGFYRDGSPMEEGPFVSGAQHGQWRYYYRGQGGVMGQLHVEATWWKGVLHGPYREYWPNGQLKASGSYRDDEPQDMTYYADDGSPAP